MLSYMDGADTDGTPDEVFEYGRKCEYLPFTWIGIYEQIKDSIMNMNIVWICSSTHSGILWLLDNLQANVDAEFYLIIWRARTHISAYIYSYACLRVD